MKKTHLPETKQSEQQAEKHSHQGSRENYGFDETPLHPMLQLQQTIGNRAVGQMIQRKKAADQENKTGLPDNLKAGLENMSNLSMDDVKVHYNSPKPPDIQALAYTKGTNIHVAPGQEKHLPHEAWHVVQQKQGRVMPTMQLKKEQVNDDSALEREADTMGRKAFRQPTTSQTNSAEKPQARQKQVAMPIIQRYITDSKGKTVSDEDAVLHLMQKEGIREAHARRIVRDYGGGTSPHTLGYLTAKARQLRPRITYETAEERKRKAKQKGHEQQKEKIALKVKAYYQELEKKASGGKRDATNMTLNDPIFNKDRAMVLRGHGYFAPNVLKHQDVNQKQFIRIGEKTHLVMYVPHGMGDANQGKSIDHLNFKHLLKNAQDPEEKNKEIHVWGPGDVIYNYILDPLGKDGTDFEGDKSKMFAPRKQRHTLKDILDKFEGENHVLHWAACRKVEEKATYEDPEGHKYKEFGETNYPTHPDYNTLFRRELNWGQLMGTVRILEEDLEAEELEHKSIEAIKQLDPGIWKLGNERDEILKIVEALANDEKIPEEHKKELSKKLDKVKSHDNKWHQVDKYLKSELANWLRKSEGDLSQFRGKLPPASWEIPNIAIHESKVEEPPQKTKQKTKQKNQYIHYESAEENLFEGRAERAYLALKSRETSWQNVLTQWDSMVGSGSTKYNGLENVMKMYGNESCDWGFGRLRKDLFLVIKKKLRHEATRITGDSEAKALIERIDKLEQAESKWSQVPEPLMENAIRKVRQNQDKEHRLPTKFNSDMVQYFGLWKHYKKN